MNPAPVARLDADVLLAHVLHCTRSELFSRDRHELTPQQQEQLARLMARRAAGEPVAYLVGQKEFWSLKLQVTPDVLIPRPETELLVDWGSQVLSSRRKPGPSVLDMGTGSGAIALAVAKEFPAARVIAVDISAAALDVARRNAQSLELANVSFAESNLFKALDAGFRRHDGGFDLIISNPPYIAENDPHLADLRFEPTLALTAGPDGLSALRRITADAEKYLKPGGWLLLEHGAEQGAAVRALFQAAGFGQIETRRDLAGHERATAGQNP